MLRLTKQGFTLIELMVVIVIIGVLASLAIPRFTDASNKAKVAEAPRVLASFESAYLAGVAEGNVATDNLVFNVTAVSADSKWFNYTLGIGSSTPADGHGASAIVRAALGKVKANDNLTTKYSLDTEVFSHAANTTELGKYVPNFVNK